MCGAQAIESLLLTPRSELIHNNDTYLLQLGCHPVVVVILHVNKI